MLYSGKGYKQDEKQAHYIPKQFPSSSYTPTTYKHEERKGTPFQERYSYTFTASAELLNRAINLENQLSLSLWLL